MSSDQKWSKCIKSRPLTSNEILFRGMYCNFSFQEKLTHLHIHHVSLSNNWWKSGTKQRWRTCPSKRTSSLYLFLLLQEIITKVITNTTPDIHGFFTIVHLKFSLYCDVLYARVISLFIWIGISLFKPFKRCSSLF